MSLLSILMFTANVSFYAGVACLPLSDAGPHLANGWGQTVRLRHLYASKHGLHLQISGDGKVHGSSDQTLHSLVEIRPVDTGCVAIKGVVASQFLCMKGNGRLYTSHTFTKDDCIFQEQILPDGYNIYISKKHGILVSLGDHRQCLQGRGQGLSALSQFLPRVNTLGLGTAKSPIAIELMVQPEPNPTRMLRQDSGVMNSIGKLLEMSIHSPSFNKR